MKNVNFIIALTAFILTAFPAVQEIQAQTRPQDFRGGLSVFSFTDEIDKIINNYFKRAYRNVSISSSHSAFSDSGDRIRELQGFFTSRQVPDIIALEAGYVRTFVESGNLLDLTDIYEANRNKILPYTAEVGTYNGRVYALSWQACPGAFFYRRSLAKKYLGTDDPAIVQTYFTNVNRLAETARLLKEKSNGACHVTLGPNDLLRPFLSMRANPWIVNGQFTIDPAIEQYLDTIKTFADNGWITGCGQWSAEWFAGMKGELKQHDGTSHLGRGAAIEVFGYFLPSWGLHYVLKTNAPATSGDWAMIQGPIPYQWGGTWLAVSGNTQNPQLAKEFIRYVTTDDAFLERYARDTGDIVSNIIAQERVRGNFRERFLGNQNHYLLLSEISRNINGSLIQAHDETIQLILSDMIGQFVWEGKTKAQFLADFRAKVNAELRLR